MRSRGSSARFIPHHAPLIALLLAVGAFYTATIRTGNTWGDDFALYIQHAKNIATGVPYAETGYIYNPAEPEYGPRAYPPVFPLLLAPVYRVLGLNFWAMKAQQVIFFVLTLMATYAYFRQLLEAAGALTIIAIIGVNPVFWEAKDSILSDLLFMFFFWLVLWLISQRDAHDWRWGLLLGGVTYLAIGTRTIGIVIVGGLVVYEIISERRPTGGSVIAALTCALLLGAQTLILGSGQSSYLDQLHPTMAGLLKNTGAYTRALGTFWIGSSRGIPAFTLLAIVGGLAVRGAYVHVKRGVGAVECILLLYFCAVVVWPAPPGLRFLYPLIPFYVYLVIVGLSQLTHGKQYKCFALPGLVLLCGIVYLQTYSRAATRTISETDGLASFNDMCHHVEIGTDGDDVFLCRRPRALALFTGRAGAVYHPGDDDAIWEFANKIGTGYVLCNRRETQDVEYLLPFVRRHRDKLELAYQNTDFELYRIHSYEPTANDSKTKAAVSSH